MLKHNIFKRINFSRFFFFFLNKISSFKKKFSVIIFLWYKSFFKKKFLFEKNNLFLVEKYSYLIKNFKNRIISSEYNKYSEYKNIYRHLKKCFFNHKFNVLGLGWKNSFSKVDFKNLNDFEKKLYFYIKTFDDSYEFIDWKSDLKTNIKWDDKLYFFIPIVKENFSDIKTPWELSRLQHLPFLIFNSLLFDSVSEQKEVFRESKNQILDFILQNKPFYTVNWVNSMEVSIRAVNLIFSYNLLFALDKKQLLEDVEFSHIFNEYLFLHGKFIFLNLEKSINLTTNHYLSNILGLLYISLFLEPNNNSSEIKKWFFFSIRELKKEFKKQFFNEGTNFESSTSYHALSSQIILLSYLLIKKFNGKKLFGRTFSSSQYFDNLFERKLLKSILFLKHITKSNKKIVQIGDNDSGRIIKPVIYGSLISLNKAKEKYYSLMTSLSDEDIYFDENLLLYENIISFSSILFNYEEIVKQREVYPLEFFFGKLFFDIPYSKTFSDQFDTFFYYKKNANNILNIKKKLKYTLHTKILFKKYHLDLKGLKSFLYPNFGITIFRSDIKGREFFLSIFNGPIGQKNIGGHSHNDKLSIELNIKGIDLIVDPGSYVYTGNIFERNNFRSTLAHSVPFTFEEQTLWAKGYNGLFSLFGNIKTQNFVLSENKSIHYLEFYSKKGKTIIIREICIKENFLEIFDYSNKPLKPLFNTFSLYSEGYGKKTSSGWNNFIFKNFISENIDIFLE